MGSASVTEYLADRAVDEFDWSDPGTLKLSLLVEGLALESGMEERLREEGHWLAVGPGLNRLELQLDDEIVVAPVVVTKSSNRDIWTLARADGHFVLRRGTTSYPVRAPVRPRFYEQRTSAGRRIGDFAQVLDRTLVLGGHQACGFGVSGTACRFCRVGSRSESERTFGVTAHEAAEAVSAAARERALRYVFLPAASFDAEDGGVSEIEPLVKAVRRHTSALVLAALHPPRTLRWIDHAYAIGVDGIAFNLEVPDVVILERLLPGRARYLGRSRYYHALRHAGKIFPQGAVWSELLLGTASVEELATVLREFVSWSVMPFFVSVRPDTNIRLLPISFKPTTAEAKALLHSLAETLTASNARVRWLPEWPHLLGPTDALRTLSSSWRNGKSQGLVADLTFFALRQFSRIRRSLRVHDLADHDSESAG